MLSKNRRNIWILNVEKTHLDNFQKNLVQLLSLTNVIIFRLLTATYSVMFLGP